MDSMRTEGLSSSQREDLMDQVKQQIVIANTQELLTVRGEGWADDGLLLPLANTYH